MTKQYRNVVFGERDKPRGWGFVGEFAETESRKMRARHDVAQSDELDEYRRAYEAENKRVYSGKDFLSREAMDKLLASPEFNQAQLTPKAFVRPQKNGATW